MKKTVTINLAGQLFHIDEDAYLHLKHYLKAIRDSLSANPDLEEIIQDIEARIAELLLEKREEKNQVVTIYLINEVIARMGQPEDYNLDFDEEETEQASKINASHPYFKNRPKMFFRDEINGYISGVCSGLGHFMGISAVWFRILLVLLTLFTNGSILILYIILWIYVPAARTANQRLIMLGKEVNLSNIEKSRSGEEIKFNQEESKAINSKIGRTTPRTSVNFFNSLGRIAIVLLKIGVKILGLALIVTAAVGLSALVYLFFSAIYLDAESVQLPIIQFIEFFNISYWATIITAIFLIGIPLLVFAVIGLKLLVNYTRHTSQLFKISLLVLWFAALISAGILVTKTITQVSFGQNTIEKKLLNFNKETPFKLSPLKETLPFQYNDYDITIKETTDSIPSFIIVYKEIKSKRTGKVFQQDNLELAYEVLPNELKISRSYLDAMFFDDIDDMDLILYLPEGYSFSTQLRFETELSNEDKTFKSKKESYTYTLENGIITCSYCKNNEKENIDTELSTLKKKIKTKIKKRIKSPVIEIEQEISKEVSK